MERDDRLGGPSLDPDERADEDDADGPATLVFLIAAPAEGDADHLKILASLARRLVHESFRDSLRAAPDAETVAEIVTREVVPS